MERQKIRVSLFTNDYGFGGHRASWVLLSMGPCAVAQGAHSACMKWSDCRIKCQELSLCAVSTSNLPAQRPWASPSLPLGVLSAKGRDVPLLPQCQHPSCPQQPGTVASARVRFRSPLSGSGVKEALTFDSLVCLCFAKPTKGRGGWERLLCVLFAESSALLSFAYPPLLGRLTVAQMPWSLF